MSMSVTGRQRDWLSLTPCSILSNGIQARYGLKVGATGEEGEVRTDKGEVFCCDQLGPFDLET